ncbi:MAG: aldehyde dehydrogenase family protein [Victivallaceae bacterium]|nr:aldehyde dehydrogenase family protein [Victivallaceae bacterium]
METAGFNEQLSALRAFQRGGGLRTAAQRRELLLKLRDIMKAEHEKLLAALWNDLHKSESEAVICELALLSQVMRRTLRNLRAWTRPVHRNPGIFNFPASALLYPEPYGVALIGGTWNYPLLLSLEPLIAAIAAGNAAVLRISDTVPSSARMLRKIVAALDSPGVITTELDWSEVLAEKYDFIFYTGNPRMGRAVMLKAAESLTPLVLELGGKSPCVVAKDADIASAARRIVWGKFLNAGQTCVAPDYLWVHRDIKDRLMREIRSVIKAFYGEVPQESPDYGRIVNDFHFKRLLSLLADGRLICGGETDSLERYIAPTVVDMVNFDMPVMQQEIFGPILPVLEFESDDEVIQQIANRPKPLALYLFSRDRKLWRRFASETSSGGMAINVTVMQLAAPGLPFGGVGESGMGAYHGRAGFDAFTHYKSILVKRWKYDWPLTLPPFTSWKKALLKYIGK